MVHCAEFINESMKYESPVIYESLIIGIVYNAWPPSRHLQCYKYLYKLYPVTRRSASVCTNGVIMGLDGGGGTYLLVLITKQS